MLSNKVAHNAFSESFIIDKDLINEINRPVQKTDELDNKQKQLKTSFLGKIFKKS